MKACVCGREYHSQEWLTHHQDCCAEAGRATAKGEIEVNETPSGRWYWSVGAHSGEAPSRDAAYERARDVQRIEELKATVQAHKEDRTHDREHLQVLRKLVDDSIYVMACRKEPMVFPAGRLMEKLEACGCETCSYIARARIALGKVTKYKGAGL